MALQTAMTPSDCDLIGELWFSNGKNRTRVLTHLQSITVVIISLVLRC